MEKGTQGGASGKNQPPKDEGRGPGRERVREAIARRTTLRKAEREREREEKKRDRRCGERGGKTRRREGDRILTQRWGMSCRVVCSHGSSLGTAVQYAGQGKVTLFYVCVRVRSRCPLYYSYTSLRSRSLFLSLSLSPRFYRSWRERESKRMKIRRREKQIEKDERRRSRRRDGGGKKTAAVAKLYY